MAERNANLGYLAVAKETTKGTIAAVPSIYVPIYSEGLTTDPHFVRDNAIIGSKFKNFLTVMGNREHNGDVEILGEPNIAGYLFDMFMTKGAPSGSDPYTHPFTFSKTTDPKSYTVDISYVSHVVRFLGVEVGDVEPGWEEGEMRLKAAMVARKCWAGREIASISGTGPYTIVFTQTYDRSPTEGLIVGDLIQVFDVSLGTYINAIVDTIENATSITVSEDVSAAAAGDFVTLRPASAPSLSLLTPFLWGNTEFRFGADASAALSAGHTALEEDSGWHLMHEFEDNAGAHRSGSFDPASYPRMQGDAEFHVKKYFDTPSDLIAFNALAKKSVVARHFAYVGANTYELRITLNHVKNQNPKPKLESESILYTDMDLAPQYDSSDGQGADVKVINGVASF